MRIAALSDLHGWLPEIPECDVVVFAGDICADGYLGKWARHHPRVQGIWMEEKFLPYLEKWKHRFTHAVGTWGNHDYLGKNPTDYPDHGPFDVVVDDYLKIGMVVGEPFKFWFSPWSHTFMDWCWMLSPEDLAKKHALIPSDVDILVSHAPPFGYGDEADEYDGYGNPTGKRIHVGEPSLLEAINRIKPKLVICGHIHGGFGKYTHSMTATAVGGTDAFELDIPIYNVSVVNEQYQLVNPVTIIDI